VEEMAHKISLLPPALRSVAEYLVNSLVAGEEQVQSESQTKDKIIHAVNEVK